MATLNKKQYTKDKVFRFTFRVNETLYNWVQTKSEKLGVTPCDYVRTVIFNQMASEDFFRNIDDKKDRCSDCEASNENTKKHK